VSEFVLSGAATIGVPHSPLRAGAAVMAASGFAGLGYQIVWTQQGAAWLGHDAAAVLAVVAAFFGGLALGALALGRRITRSMRPARWYAACELLVACWTLVLAAVAAPAADTLLAVIGPAPSPTWHWTVAFVGMFVLLLPATVAMGATLPAMEHTLRARGSAGARLAGLYAANTFGAVVGVLATAFWLVPALGLQATAWVCAAFNLLCAATAWHWAAPAMPAPDVPAGTERRTLATLAATGLLGIGYEVLVVRVLSQVTEDTVYTFALLLAVYLGGTALGAAGWSRRRDAGGRARRDEALLCAQAVACLLGIGSLWVAPALRDAVQHTLGAGFAAALAAEAALALAAFGLPTVVMGALFSELAARARQAGHGVGELLGWNTLGAALAAPLFGVLLATTLGPRSALLAIVAGYLALAWRGSRTGPAFWAAGAAACVVAASTPALSLLDVPPGGRVLSHVDGTLAAVSVVEDADGVATLRINNRQQEGSSATVFADARQALLPMLLHPAPQRALFLGLGTGITARAAADDAALEVDAVELLPEVVEASAQFAAAFPASPRLHVTAADARRHVRTSRAVYDLVVADNFHPARSGSGTLYTVEHFAAVRDRLAPDGLFCQWLPLHQIDLPTLRSVVRSFLAVNPHAGALLATNSLDTPVLGLVGRRGELRFDVAAVRARVATLRTSRPPAAFGLPDALSVLGSFVAGPDALARFAADAPLNTDDRPVVSYRAPRITYAPDSSPRERLFALLDQFESGPDAPAPIAPAADAAQAQQLADYRRARHRFLLAGRDVRPDADPHRMLAQVREPLLEVLRISPEFRPAFEPLMRLAAAIAPADPDAARQLLDELESLRTTRNRRSAVTQGP
jgi:spermidine synthase